MEENFNQYIISLNNLYRAYNRYFPKINYDYLNKYIEHYSKKKFSEEEGKKADEECKKEWGKFLYLFINKIRKDTKRYFDLIEKQFEDLENIETKIKLNGLLLGDYEEEWNKLEKKYIEIRTKIAPEKRNIKRNWWGYLISFILGVGSTLLTTYLLRGFS